MAHSTISQTLPGTEAWFVFYGFCCFVLLCLLPLLALIILVGTNINFLEIPNPLTKITIFFILNYCIFGFWVVFVKLKEYWEESFIAHQRAKYMAKPAQQIITFELNIPANYQYKPSSLVKMFSYMRAGFKTANVSKQIQLNYGRCFADLAFDFVVHKSEIKSYVTIPKKKYYETVEMFKRFFPDIEMKVVPDIYQNWPKTWREDTNIDEFRQLIGFHLGYTESNIYPTPFSFEMPVSNMPMDMMMRALRDVFPDQKIILQQVFRFNPSNNVGSYPENISEFKSYRQGLFDKYAPLNTSGKKDSHAFEALMPYSIKNAIDLVAQHMEGANIGFTYRIVALCANKEQAGQVFKTLERLLRIYSSTIGEYFASNYLSVQYITSNFQEYSTKNPIHPNFKSIYETFIFPTWLGVQLETLTAPFYQKYYYPNENRYRTIVNYKTLIKRDFDGQWNGDWNIGSPMSIPAIWQLPSMSMNPNQLQTVQQNNSVDIFQDFYENN
jgi:hypothetical protein